MAGEEAFEDKAPGIIVASGGSGKSMLTRTMESRLRSDNFFVMRELQTFIQESTNLEMFKTWMEGKPFISGKRCEHETNLHTIATTIADENDKALKLGPELDRRMFRIPILSDDELNRCTQGQDRCPLPDKVRLSSSDVKLLGGHLRTASKKRYGMSPRVKNPLQRLQGDAVDHKIKHIINPCSPRNRGHGLPGLTV